MDRDSTFARELREGVREAKRGLEVLALIGGPGALAEARKRVCALLDRAAELLDVLPPGPERDAAVEALAEAKAELEAACNVRLH